MRTRTDSPIGTEKCSSIAGVRIGNKETAHKARNNPKQRPRFGLKDLWEDDQDLDAALEDTKESETAILISHNPDYVESITDPRVGLVLSGHTHGGQVVLPVVGAPRVPSRFGQKYLYGLVKTPHTQVYVTRGLGTVTPPVRFCCHPEIVLVTIV